jgi:nucleoside-diphosphate-sugar epimerase
MYSVKKHKTPETKSKNTKIVVLGGTGLIGSKVVNLLYERGHEAVAASPPKASIRLPEKV